MFRKLLIASTIPVAFTTGCSSLSHTENGALAGGGLGALTGAVIGSQTGHTAGGAAIGGAIGAVTGGLIGNSHDQTERKVEAAHARAQLGVQDVVQMAHSHISDEVIVNHIRASGTVFQLSAQDTIWLKQNGVSDRVVSEMQATCARPAPALRRPPGLRGGPLPTAATRRDRLLVHQI